jgi:hypothetical protein
MRCKANQSEMQIKPAETLQINNNGRRKIYTTVMNSILRNGLSNSTTTATTTSLSQIASQKVAVTSSRPSLTWTAPFKSLRASGRSKNWYLLRSNSSNHSLYNHHHHHHHHHQLQSMPAFSVESIGSSILTPEQITTLWRWLPNRFLFLNVFMHNTSYCIKLSVLKRLRKLKKIILLDFNRLSSLKSRIKFVIF